MRDFNGVMKELKLYLSNNSNVKILDKDVAEAIGITQANFATIKRRKSIPYKGILEFCEAQKLCCSEIFFEKNSLTT